MGAAASRTRRLTVRAPGPLHVLFPLLELTPPDTHDEQINEQYRARWKILLSPGLSLPSPKTGSPTEQAWVPRRTWYPVGAQLTGAE